MLSIKTPITVDDIHGVYVLAPGHPVYRLEGWGNSSGKVDSIVIKNESGKGTNVQAAAMIMNVVDRNARQIPLSNQEIQALREFATYKDLPNVECFRAAKEVVKALSQGGTWLKMDLKQLMNLDSAVAKLATGDKSDARIIARSLTKSGGLEKLGEIVAADLFNGSNDRFAYPAIAVQPGSQVVQNKGNIFIACEKIGKGSPVGLDNFDPYSQHRHISGDQAKNMDLSKETWGGHLLLRANKAYREAFIKALVADLEVLLGGERKRKNPFGSKNRLGTARTSRISKGMESGAKKLQKAFANWRRQGQKSNREFEEGVSRKLSTLGW